MFALIQRERQIFRDKRHENCCSVEKGKKHLILLTLCRWEMGCRVAADDEFCSKMLEVSSRLWLLEKRNICSVGFLPRCVGDGLVLKWYMIALWNCHFFSRVWGQKCPVLQSGCFFYRCQSRNQRLVFTEEWEASLLLSSLLLDCLTRWRGGLLWPD